MLTGVTSPGCGNETAMAQIAAEFLGCEIDQVAVIQGDTDSCPYGLGNFSSRATMYGGSAVQIAATELREKMFRIAGKMLEAAPEDLDAGDGKIFVQGAESRNVAFTDVANQVYRHTFGEFAEDEEPGLESTRFFRMGNVYHQPEKQGRFSNYPAWPSGSAACIVEVDPDTGKVDVLRFCLVDDAGQDHQSLAGDGQPARLSRPGHRRRDVRAFGLRRQGSVAHRNAHGLHHPDCRRVAAVRSRASGDSLAVHAARHEGRRRVGDRRPASNALCSAIESAFPELDLEIDSLTLTPSNVWRAHSRSPASRRSCRVITRELEVLRPRTAGEALEILERSGDDATILAGGMSLMPMMNPRHRPSRPRRFAEPCDRPCRDHLRRGRARRRHGQAPGGREQRSDRRARPLAR